MSARLKRDMEKIIESSGGSQLGATYDKGLMELRAKKTLFPVVSNDATDGFWQTLLNGKGHARAIINKL